MSDKKNMNSIPNITDAAKIAPAEVSKLSAKAAGKQYPINDNLKQMLRDAQMANFILAVQAEPRLWRSVLEMPETFIPVPTTLEHLYNMLSDSDRKMVNKFVAARADRAAIIESMMDDDDDDEYDDEDECDDAAFGSLRIPRADAGHSAMRFENCKIGAIYADTDAPRGYDTFSNLEHDDDDLDDDDIANAPIDEEYLRNNIDVNDMLADLDCLYTDTASDPSVASAIIMMREIVCNAVQTPEGRANFRAVLDAHDLDDVADELSAVIELGKFAVESICTARERILEMINYTVEDDDDESAAETDGDESLSEIEPMDFPAR